MSYFVLALDVHISSYCLLFDFDFIDLLEGSLRRLEKSI